MDGTVVEVRQPGRRPLLVVVEDQLDLGRECDGLLLADPEVSRRHARLALEGGRLTVVDLGSTNGTTVNGALVTVATPVGVGDVVQVGATELRVRAQPGPREHATAEPGTSAMDMAKAVMARFDLDPDADPRQTSIERVAALVEREKPAPPPVHGGDGDTLTIVFSDIESSTEQALRLGDKRWFDLLAIHNSIVRNNLRRYDGSEVKSQGDGFMLTFASARRAVQCCIDVQRAFRKFGEEHPDEAIRIRIGIHTGEAIVDAGGDLFGKHIIVAARIANLADGGQILTSHVTREITSSRGDLAFGPPRTVTLKGIEGTYSVSEVSWA